MMTMSPVLSLRSDGRGLPKNIAGFAIGVEPMMRKSMSPPPWSMAEPAAPRRSASVAPGFAVATIASMARWHKTPALRTQSSSSALLMMTSSWTRLRVKTSSTSGTPARRSLYWLTGR